MSTASSSSRPWVWVASLSAEQHASLRAGVNLLNAAAAPADEAQQAHSSDRQHQRSFPLILFRKDDGSIVVSKNQCRHNGGRFVQSSPEKSADGHQASVPASSGSSSSSGASCPPVVDMEDLGRSPVLTCSFHGWQLNAETLDYVKPPDCLKQEALRIDNSPQTDSGAFKIFQRQPYEPWKSKGTTHAEGHQQQQQAAQQVSSIAAPLDLKISYISHACVEISAGGRRLVTDPWLTGPSFGRGWWLLHEPPADAYERVASADAIYISHGHPDHFNIPTLRRIAAINPAVPLYIPQLSVDVFSDALQQLGFTNVRFTPMGEWQQLDGSSSAPGGPDDDSLGRFMILPDDLFPHLDTFLLFEYRGRRVLNLVDCCSPNGDHLPSPVDVLLTDFASGASGFPACFVEQFGEARATQMALDKAAVFLKKTAKHVQITQPQVWIPFAGYFTEAGPDDQLTLKVNRKNTPVGAATALRARVPSLRTWLPFPGGSYDVARKEGQQPDKPWEEYNKKSWCVFTGRLRLAARHIYLPLLSVRAHVVPLSVSRACTGTSRRIFRTCRTLCRSRLCRRWRACRRTSTGLVSTRTRCCCTVSSAATISSARCASSRSTSAGRVPSCAPGGRTTERALPAVRPGPSPRRSRRCPSSACERVRTCCATRCCAARAGTTCTSASARASMQRLTPTICASGITSTTCCRRWRQTLEQPPSSRSRPTSCSCSTNGTPNIPPPGSSSSCSRPASSAATSRLFCRRCSRSSPRCSPTGCSLRVLAWPRNALPRVAAAAPLLLSILDPEAAGARRPLCICPTVCHRCTCIGFCIQFRSPSKFDGVTFLLSYRPSQG